MGKLIVIEGLDGSGKSTQLDLLPKRLKENGIDCKTVSFPDYASIAVADADEVKKQQYLFLAASDTEREELENESVKAPGMSNSQGFFFFQNYGSPLRNAKGALIASKDGSFCRELSSDELDKLGAQS